MVPINKIYRMGYVFFPVGYNCVTIAKIISRVGCKGDIAISPYNIICKHTVNQSMVMKYLTDLNNIFSLSTTYNHTPEKVNNIIYIIIHYTYNIMYE